MRGGGNDGGGDGGADGGGGEGGGLCTTQAPSSLVAAESKLIAAAAMQPRASYEHAAATFASGA